MFGVKLKYQVLETADVDVGQQQQNDVLDFDSPTRKSLAAPSCVRSALFTSLLIGTYYVPSIGLTFYQRWLLQSFHLPLLIVLVHMQVKYVLAALIRLLITGRQRVLMSWRDYAMAIAPVGVFSGLDIGLSNWGLELNNVSLYTMTKSTTILFILFFSILFKLEKKSWRLSLIVIMIPTGLILFTYKATQFNLLGFILLLIASMSSGIRWTCVQLLLQKSKMGMRNPVDMIYHMQPWMIMSLLPFAVWQEGPVALKGIQQFLIAPDYHASTILAVKILLGAFIAFFMELTEVMVVTYTSSLTLAIAGIVKEILILILAVMVANDQISLINFIGLLICMSGIICHVVHKLKTTTSTMVAVAKSPPERSYGLEHHELLGDDVLGDGERGFDDLSDSEGERSDTQVLFDILNKHDR